MNHSFARKMEIAWFAVTVLISAFLVFQVQPVVSKALLPWFGGSPAVWTICMLFFQTVLFAGYAYAHCIARWPLRYQSGLHLMLVVAALWALPVVPDASWKPAPDANPTWSILWILCANVGLPYFVLSATGPLLQAWFQQRQFSSSPYRLYALSNAGSLAALLSYPVLIEPAMSTAGQSAAWSLGFCAFVLLCGYLAIRLSSQTLSSNQRSDLSENPCATAPSWRRRLSWLALPAFASMLLLATTNHVCQDLAVVPFLWVAPLSLYLLTFIICFDHERWYSRRACAIGALSSIVALCVMISYGYQRILILEVVLYFSALFHLCMLCHGELARSKPDASHLTSFYLMTSGGGALGGFAVAVLCPLLFRSYLEMNLGVLWGTSLALGMFFWEAQRSGWSNTWQRRLIAGLLYFAVFVFVGLVQFDGKANGSLASVRNFYGVLRVEGDADDPGCALVHGRVVHGLQFREARKRRFPSTYYGPESGVGLVLRGRPTTATTRVGAIGLGCGTIAAYGRPGDYYRFYEINPAVVELARQYFTYVKDSQAQVEIALGDARLSLEREPSQAFDVLVLDAFSGDAVPTHLLTREAFAVYLRHLQPRGVLAIHISNRHLRLDGIVERLATCSEMACRRVRSRAYPDFGIIAAEWMLLSRDASALPTQSTSALTSHSPPAPLWTDQYSNLYQILRAF